ncbi:MAG TPA: fused MFS/spermidine synthase [Thermoanaerobaculia bacterium]|jgi:spermidine synthase|nr:fused MFS/spermidine synthase [Thermoanaerobaculia bacterium]
MPKSVKPSPGARPAATPWLGVLVFLTGGTILVLEIVGARLLSPVFGSSLYVWSALITVTLLSLAVGYEVGGRLADRQPAHRALRRLLAPAGIFILLVPGLRGPVLDATAGLGLRLGALVSAAVLLAVPLVLLSAAGLVVARAATQSLERLGRGVGRISFYSTLGSVAGALVTGYFLIPSVPVRFIFYGAGTAVLAGMMLVALDERRLRPAFLAGVVAVVLGASAFSFRDAPDSKVLFTTGTFYGELAVIDAYPLRYLTLDGIPQSLWNSAVQENAAPYPLALEMAPLMAGGDRALVIGLGAGVLPVNLERYYGMVADSVDVNAAVADAASRYFEFRTKGRMYVEDGRTFVHRTPAGTYDVIVIDAFNGDSMPYHLMTREFLAEARRLLRPSGVLAVNAVGRFGSSVGLSGDVRSIAATLRAEFPHVRAFRLPAAGESGREIQNVLLFAGRHPLAPRPSETWRADARPILERMTAAELAGEATAGGIVLSDDYNPIDYLNAETAQEMRRLWARHKT